MHACGFHALHLDGGGRRGRMVESRTCGASPPCLGDSPNGTAPASPRAGRPGGRAPRREQPARPRERRVGPVLPALVPGRHGDRERCQDGQAGRSFLQGLPFRANRGLEVTRELPDSKDATGPAKAPPEARRAAPRSGETAPGETVGCRILRIKRRPVLARDPGLYRKRRGGSDRRLGSILRGWLVFEQRAEAATTTTTAVGVFGDDGAF